MIEIKKLTYKNILKDISISNKYPLIIIAGPVASGKTILSKIINGDIETKEQIYLDNKCQENYKTLEYYKKVRLINAEYINKEMTIKDDLNQYIEDNKIEIVSKEKLEEYELYKYRNCNIKDLSIENQIKYSLLKSIISKPENIILDSIDDYLEEEYLIDVIDKLKALNIKTIILSRRLDLGVYSSYMYIISKGKILLEGLPLEVMKEENILNKIGLSLPYMADLSVKLIDYDLLDNIENDIEELVRKLWN